MHYPGDLVAVDTFFVGTLKGVGKVYLQTVLDCFSRHAWARRPQSNGFIERFHRTLLDEHLRVKGRTTWYDTVEEMQQDLEAYLEIYNRKRPHRGRGIRGRTPYQVFKAGMKNAKKAAKQPRKEEAQQAA